MSAREPWAGVAIRAAIATDAAAIRTFLAAMDRDGLYERHFAHGEAPNLALIARLAKIDGCQRAMFLAVGVDGMVIGHAEYVASGEAAEFALMLLPAFRGAGIGRQLLETLLSAAANAGLQTMYGIIQATNTRAIQLAHKRGFHARSGEERTTVIVSRPLQLEHGDPHSPAQDRCPAPQEFTNHDPDRTSLHRRACP
jgi:acetyltransferase